MNLPAKLIDTGAEWYGYLIDHAKSCLVETGFAMRWSLIEGRHELGIIVSDAAERQGISTFNLIEQLAVDLRCSERTLYYCVEFSKSYPDLSAAPFSKEISWNDIKQKYLPHKSKELPPHKEHMESVVDAVMESKRGMNVLKKYLEYLTRHGCILCNPPQVGDVVDTHHFPLTKGAGAKDHWAIPLCRKHHGEFQEDRRMFIDLYLDKCMIFLYDSILVLFEKNLNHDQEGK